MVPSFPKTIGNDEAKRILLRQYKSSYSWLISGEKGVGKFTTLYNFTNWLLKSPAVFQLDCLIESAPKIEAIRRTKEFLFTTPSVASWKVVIIDEFEKCSINSTNALLKILEEPIQRSLIFLITHTLKGIIPTITSRCRLLRFVPLQIEEMKRVFPSKYHNLIPLSTGAPGRLYAILEAGGSLLYEKLLKFIIKKEFFNLPAEHLDTVFYLIQQIFSRIVRVKLKYSLACEIFIGEKQILEESAPLYYWQAQYQEITNLFYIASIRNLNKADLLMTWLF